tara:strand:- start:75 stop:245 length:171 start_codon:yes stop_codon:yes gene_type:complete
MFAVIRGYPAGCNRLDPAPDRNIASIMTKSRQSNACPKMGTSKAIKELVAPMANNA